MACEDIRGPLMGSKSMFVDLLPFEAPASRCLIVAFLAVGRRMRNVRLEATESGRWESFQTSILSSIPAGGSGFAGGLGYTWRTFSYLRPVNPRNRLYRAFAYSHLV